MLKRQYQGGADAGNNDSNGGARKRSYYHYYHCDHVLMMVLGSILPRFYQVRLVAGVHLHPV